MKKEKGNCVCPICGKKVSIKSINKFTLTEINKLIFPLLNFQGFQVIKKKSLC